MGLRVFLETDIYDIRVRESEGFVRDSVEMSSVAFTATRDGKPVACGGFIPAFPGCESVWMVVSDDIRGRGVWFAKAVRGIMESRAEKLKLFRVQAFVDPAKEEYQRFARLMGMQVEGFIRKATPDQKDQLLYARIW